MQVLLEEARQLYDEEIIVELESNESGDIKKSVDQIEIWINQWKGEHAHSAVSEQLFVFVHIHPLKQSSSIFNPCGL